jgi:UDP-N-acetylmuramyl tripeptide synthase
LVKPATFSIAEIRVQIPSEHVREKIDREEDIEKVIDIITEDGFGYLAGLKLARDMAEEIVNYFEDR